MSTLPLQFLILTVAGWVNRGQQDVIEYLREENRILREHVGHRRLRFTDAQRRCLARKARRLHRKTLTGIEPIVTPDTLLRWYRNLIARKYDGSGARRVGRPRTGEIMEHRVIRMAQENPGWGYTRIRGALRNLGHEIGSNTIKRMLSANDIEPASIRRKGMSWATFLKLHWGVIAATDFFTVEVLTRAGLIRFLVFFVIDLRSASVSCRSTARSSSDLPVAKDRASRAAFSMSCSLRRSSRRDILILGLLEYFLSKRRMQLCRRPKVDFSSQESSQLAGQSGHPEVPNAYTTMELDEDVDVTVGTEVLPENRAEESKAANSIRPAEPRQLLARDSYFPNHFVTPLLVQAAVQSKYGTDAIAHPVAQQDSDHVPRITGKSTHRGPTFQVLAEDTFSPD